MSLLDALFVPPGGYRSTLGTLKHVAGWYHVYRSYAFDADPRHWDQVDWPRGLRETIEPTPEYWHDLRIWLEAGHQAWLAALETRSDDQMLERRPVHWGETRPLFDIVTLMARHLEFHAGEINQLQAIRKQEAWEETEEVEENHISTLGHRVRPMWMQPG